MIGMKERRGRIREGMDGRKEEGRERGMDCDRKRKREREGEKKKT